MSPLATTSSSQEDGTDATTESDAGLRWQDFPWAPTSIPPLAQPIGKLAPLPRSLQPVLGRLLTEKEVEALPWDYFMNRPYIMPSYRDIVVSGLLLSGQTVLFLVLWGVAARSAWPMYFLRPFGSWLLACPPMYWAWSADFTLSTAIFGGQRRVTGLFAVVTMVAFTVGDLIPWDGGFVGFVGGFIVYFTLAVIPLGAYIVSVENPVANWRWWLLPVAHVFWTITPILFYGAYVMLHQYVLMKVIPGLALQIVPFILSLIETLFIIGHRWLLANMHWPLVVKARKERANGVERPWLGGDFNLLFSFAIFYQAAVAEVFRTAILVLSAINNPLEYGGVLSSMCISLFMNVANRTRWPKRVFASALRCCPKIWKTFAPAAATVVRTEVAKVAGYPRYFILLYIFIARWILTGDIVTAAWCNTGYATVVVYFGSIAAEVVEDVIVLLIEKIGFLPSWADFDRLTDGLEAGHPQFSAGPQLKIERAPFYIANQCMSTNTVWFFFAISLTVGFQELLGCGELGNITSVTLTWQENPCS